VNCPLALRCCPELPFPEEPEWLFREDEPDLLRPAVLFDERPRPEEEDERRLPEEEEERASRLRPLSS
jgi:hypothetical protein